MVERPPTTVRLCLDLDQSETHVELPMTTEGVVSRVRIVGWNATLAAAIPFIQVKFDGALCTTTLCYGAAVRSDCIQLPCTSPSYNTSFTETSIPVCRNRDFPMRFTVYLFDASTPPAPLTPTRLVIWMEIDLI